MKQLRTRLILISLLFFNTISSQVTISPEDFKILNNTSWEGTLTYLDYQSNELVPVSTTMQIKITEKEIEQNIQYTWEPNKNVLAKTKIRKNGTYLGKQKVLAKTIREDGSLLLITSAEGKDDNKKAKLFFTYEFGTNYYKVTKEVQFEGSAERFLRNTYDYTIR
ncbi:MAG: hypothetical protein WBN28_00320 [Lutimonas sp.]|jgi:hypothetical protein